MRSSATCVQFWNDRYRLHCRQEALVVEFPYVTEDTVSVCGTGCPSLSFVIAHYGLYFVQCTTVVQGKLIVQSLTYRLMLAL